MSTNSEWLRSMADKIEAGKEVRPCPKALRRVADELDSIPPLRGAVNRAAYEKKKRRWTAWE